MSDDDADVEAVIGPKTRRLPSGAIVNYVVMKVPESEPYPSGWRYRLHLGDEDGNTIVRYDNSHEDTKGHERHTEDEVETIDFPGMMDLYNRFQAEVKERERYHDRSE